MATGAIELKLIFSAGGAGGVAASIGSMTSRMDALTKSSVQTTDRMNAMGLSAVDSFAKEKAAVVAASRAVAEHQAATTRMGKSLSEARAFQSESTKALQDYQAELAKLDVKPTQEQSLKLKLLREQATGAEKDVKNLTRQFDDQRKQGKELVAGLTEQTRKVQALREEMKTAGVNTAKLGEERVRLRRQMEQEQRTLDKLTSKYERLVSVQKDVTKYKAEFNDRKMNAVAAAGVGATLAAPVAVSAQFEDKIKQISITGELYKEKGAEAALADKVRAAAVKNGISHDNVAGGVERLVAQGMDAKVAGNYAGMLSKVAKATRADMGDLAELVYTLQTKFKLKTEGEVFDAINVLTKAGKLGQYEIKAMAKAFPELGGAAASFGSTGMAGVKEMGAMMQTMRAGSGSAGEAETYMRNWFSHMSSNTTQENFKKVGIDFEKAKLDKVVSSKGKTSNVEASFMVFDDYINKVVESGQVKTYDKKGKLKSSTDMKAELKAAMDQAQKDGLQGEALTQYVQSAVQRVGLSSVLQDMQATQAYLAWMTGRDRYQETRQTLDKKEVKGTIDRDFEEQNRLTTAQWERLKTSMMDLSITIGNVLSPAVGSVLGGISHVADKFNALATKYPEIASVIVVVVGAIAAFTAALLALGAAASLARLGLASGRSIPVVGRLLGKPGSLGRAAAAVKTAGGGVLAGIAAKLMGKAPPPPPPPRVPPSAGGFSALGKAAASQSAAPGWLSRLNPLGSIFKTAAPKAVEGASSAAAGASKMVFRPVDKVTATPAPSISPRAPTSSSSAIASTAGRDASRLLAKLSPVGNFVGKAATPLAVAGALYAAGSALASTAMSRTDKASAVGGAAGGLAGGLAGAKLGALVGTMVFPGVGTVVGGLVGGVAGSLLGEKLGSHAGKALAPPSFPKSVLPPIPLVPAKPAAADKKAAPIEIKLEYKPQITIHGDPTPQTLQRFADMLRANQSTLEAMLRRALADQQRRAY